MRDMLLVLNYDSRYASALALKLRAERIDCRILPGDTPFETVIAQEAMGLVLAGSTKGELPDSLDGRLLSCGIPILAMGDTALAVNSLLGGQLHDKQAVQDVETVSFLKSKLTQELSESERYITVLRPLGLPQDLQPLAQIGEQVIGFMHQSLPIYGFSFQLESNDVDGVGILMSFAQAVCGCSTWLSDSAFIAATKQELQRFSGSGQAVCAMTGGLDSGVSAVLAHQVLGQRLQCVFIDTGLLRENEAEDFLSYYRGTLNMNILHINAQERFLSALSGLTDQREKAGAVADCYMQVLGETLSRLSFDLVIRGTSANDLLGTDGSLPRRPFPSDKPSYEPLRELFKEEIRDIGVALGLPQEICQAQPFPGTGLALRIRGEVTAARLQVLRKADALFREEVKAAGMAKRLWKYFAMLDCPPEQGDSDALSLALRAVMLSSTADLVRALPARLPYDLLENYCRQVMELCPEIKRVVNDITPGSSFSMAEAR